MEIIKGTKYFEAPPVHSVREILDHSLALYPERDAMVFRPTPKDQPVHKTYRELGADVDALLCALLAARGQGGNIAMVGDNSYSWMISYLATASGLGMLVPLDRLLSGEELASLLQRGEVSCLMVDGSLMESIRPYLKDCPDLQLCVGMQLQRLMKKEEETRFAEELQSLGKQYITMEQLLEAGHQLLAQPELLQNVDPPVLPGEDEVAVLLFTSGTTAMSKAVMLSNGNLGVEVRALLETVKFKDPMRSLSMLPLHHTFENTCGFLTVLAMGGCIYIYDGLRYIAQNMQEYHVHITMGVPTVFEMIHRRINQTIDKQGKRKAFNFARRLSKGLRFFGIDVRRKLFKEVLSGLGGEFYIAISGAAALDKDVIQFFDDIGIEILQGYGLTETAPVVAGCNTQYNVIGTCGTPLSGVTLAIDNEKAGEPGEILIKGGMVMKGYYKNQEATDEAFHDKGWLRTGDIGRIDPKTQCLILTGRTKSMIVLPSGKKVFPEEIEVLLNRNEFVKDSLVFGQEDKNGDIVLTAKIVLDQEAMAKEGKLDDQAFVQQTIQEYISKANESLPTFKGIRSYAYSFQDMIKTTTLKVKRSVEAERLKELIDRTKLSWHELTGQNLDLLEQGKDPQPPAEAGSQEPAAAESRKDYAALPLKALLEEEQRARETASRQLDSVRLQFDRKLLEEDLHRDKAVRVKRQAEKTEAGLLHAEYQQKLQQLHSRYEREIRDIKEASRKETDNLMREKAYALIHANRSEEETLTLLHGDLERRREQGGEAHALEEKNLREELKRHAEGLASQLREQQKELRLHLKKERRAVKDEEIQAQAALKRRCREAKEQRKAVSREAKLERKQYLKLQKASSQESKQVRKKLEEEMKKSSREAAAAEKSRA